ncbi:unnamed protein product [Leptosia nina]|uniref:Deformed epidermal autoregulatory factor 1 n=1 Tax=Leptosia nina TaxID=320188 RepID=A0AAV1JZG8_9NEOP
MQVMANKRSSDAVVMPKTAEVNETDPLAIVAEHDNDDCTAVETVAVASSKTSSGLKLSNNSSGIITVPVSLPVGALVTGCSFNVIPSEPLPHFKPMLCVDNGFISSGSLNQKTKPTHIVIQDSVGSTLNDSKDSEEEILPFTRNANNQSWLNVASMPVLPIRCKNTSAELHKCKLGSGGRGKCIFYRSEWYTPSEFEALCGRASSKDWKRSIRFGGRSIQTLIEEGILKPHATSCTCGSCCDDLTATGPVRLFKPYQRKRRNQDSEDDQVKLSRKKRITEDSNIDNIHQTSNSNSKEDWQTLAVDLDNNEDYNLLTDDPTSEDISTSVEERKEIELPDMSSVIKRIEDIGQILLKLNGELKQCAEDVRLINTRQLEHIDRTTELLAAATNASSGVDGQVDGEEVSLQNSDSEGTKKCANCNRAASAECSLCRRTPYCSTYCQKKDWASHQIDCLRNVPQVFNSEGSSHQSIMLIVENPQ